MRAELKCEVRTRCRVKAIHRAQRRLTTSQGSIKYDRLVLAVGARQRIILPNGGEPAWLHTVNSLDDFHRWYAALASARCVILIGAGLIGCEFADDLLSHGVDVTLVDPAPWPLARLLPQPMGEAVARALEARGARLHMRRVVQRLECKAGGCYAATLDDGTTVHADRILSATGLVPNTTLAESVGIECGIGVRVDQQLRTSNPHIFAIGNCAETPAGFLPFIQPIMVQARSNAAAGSWLVNGEGNDLAGVFVDEAGRALGFATTGTAVTRQHELVPQMSPLLAA